MCCCFDPYRPKFLSRFVYRKRPILSSLPITASGESGDSGAVPLSNNVLTTFRGVFCIKSITCIRCSGPYYLHCLSLYQVNWAKIVLLLLSFCLTYDTYSPSASSSIFLILMNILGDQKSRSLKFKKSDPCKKIPLRFVAHFLALRILHNNAPVWNKQVVLLERAANRWWLSNDILFAARPCYWHCLSSCLFTLCVQSLQGLLWETGGVVEMCTERVGAKTHLIINS